MAQKIIILILSVLAIYLLTHYLKTKTDSNTETKRVAFATKLVEDLEKLNYFEYIETENIHKAKNIFLKNSKPNDFICSYFDDKYDLLPHRYFHLDGESNDEIYGFEYDLKDLKPFFEIRGLNLNKNDYQDTFNAETGIRNTILVLNNNKYIVYDNEQVEHLWIDSPVKFINILNQELEKQGSDEKVYLGNGGNDGYAIFLTLEQFNYFDKLTGNYYEKPLDTKTWKDLQTGKI